MAVTHIDLFCGGQIPDGVLISGDVANGKTGYLERAMQVRPVGVAPCWLA